MKAAEAGNNTAMNYLGWMYENGQGVEKDLTKAFAWYLKAAEAGNASAMNTVGNAYFIGKGLEQNYDKAYLWLRKSADAGYGASMSYLGWMHLNGSGTAPRNNEYAMNWFIDSYLNGYEKAIDSINAMLEKGQGLDVYYERYDELVLSQFN